jgi:hypothetical protein
VICLRFVLQGRAHIPPLFALNRNWKLPIMQIIDPLISRILRN